MAFWGIEVKPGKPFTHSFNNVRGRLHISQATLGIGSSTKTILVQCNVGDKSPVLLCALLPDKTECCHLDLNFEEADQVIFSVIGPRSVHLTGYYLGGGWHPNVDDDTESYGEDIANTETEKSSDYSDEDDYDDSFIDDGDPEVLPSSPVANGGVIIEEILDKGKPKNGKGRRKRLKKKYQYQSSESENDGSSRQQKIVNGSNGVPVLESEDEDKFPIFSLYKSRTSAKNTKSEKVDKETGETGNKKTKDDGNHIIQSKRKADAVVIDGEPERKGAERPCNTLRPATKAGPENGKNPKKRRKQRAKTLEADSANCSNALDENKVQLDEAKADNMGQDLPVKNEDQKPATDNVDIHADRSADGNQSEKKMKKKKKSKIHENEGEANLDLHLLLKEENNRSLLEIKEKNADAKSSQVRTLSNGLVIEELEMGQPDGKIASSGKKVSVRYIGKLKKSGQIFDSNIDGAPFKFRLGAEKIIKGWNVGLDGMRVGEQRRLIIPPSLGYGSQGDGENIPPNSWLVFDVELVRVR